MFVYTTLSVVLSLSFRCSLSQDRNWNVLEPVLESLPRLIENKSYIMSANWAAPSSSHSGAGFDSYEVGCVGASTPFADPHPGLAQLCDALCLFVSEKNFFPRLIQRPDALKAQQQQQQQHQQHQQQSHHQHQQRHQSLDSCNRFSRSDFHVKVSKFFYSSQNCFTSQEICFTYGSRYEFDVKIDENIADDHVR